MREDDYEFFIEQMGEACSREAVPEEAFNKYQGVLADVLLEFWRREGWCSYADGIFWTVNPEDYEGLIEDWLEETPFRNIDKYHVVARTAFGDLYAYGERTGRKITISCPINSIIAIANEVTVPTDDRDMTLEAFLLGSKISRFDITDDNEIGLFDRALKKLGPLKSNEVYGFVPALVAGGAWSLDNLQKLDLQVHLSILRELGGPPDIPFANIDVSKYMS